jgi:hypothetical protein
MTTGYDLRRFMEEYALEEATDVQKSALREIEKVLGNHHPITLTSIHNLASTYSYRGRNVKGARLLQAVLEGRRGALGVINPYTFITMDELAKIYRDNGNWPEAIKLQEEGLEILWRIILERMDSLFESYSESGKPVSLVAEKASEMSKELLNYFCD